MRVESKEKAKADAYDKAAKIADQLLAKGIPVLGFSDFDLGAKIGIAFQLSDGRAKYACRLPTETATAEEFERFYREVE